MNALVWELPFTWLLCAGRPSREGAQQVTETTTNFPVLFGPSGGITSCFVLRGFLLLFFNLDSQFEERSRANAGGLCFVNGRHAAAYAYNWSKSSQATAQTRGFGFSGPMASPARPQYGVRHVNHA